MKTILPCSRICLTLLIAVVCGLAGPHVSLARDVPFGNLPRIDGNWFRLECRPGTFLIGLEGYAGDWIDSVAIGCAEWRAGEQRFVRTRTGGMTAGRSVGGRPAELRCDNPSSAIQTLSGDWSIVEDAEPGRRTTVLLRWLRAGCWNHAEQTAFAPPSQFGPPDPEYPTSVTFNRGCGAGELATGIFGKETKFITGLGLICQPAPKRLPPIVDGVENRQEDRSYPIPSPRGDAGRYIPGRVELPGRPPAPPVPPPQAPPPSQGTEQYPDLPNAGPAEPVKSGKRTYGFRYPHIQDASGQYLLLDWCSLFGTECGQPAADMFCWSTLGKKYRAIDFAEAKGIGARRATLTIRAQQVCAAKHCSGFQYVTCKKR